MEWYKLKPKVMQIITVSHLMNLVVHMYHQNLVKTNCGTRCSIKINPANQFNVELEVKIGRFIIK